MLARLRKPLLLNHLYRLRINANNPPHASNFTLPNGIIVVALLAHKFL